MQTCAGTSLSSLRGAGSLDATIDHSGGVDERQPHEARLLANIAC